MASSAAAARQGDSSLTLPAADPWLERWLPLIFGGLALLVYGLWYWNPIYRHDEYLVAVSRTQLPWNELLRVITTADPGAGPLYLLMKPWTAISSDPAWTRIPSVVAMAIATGTLVAFAKRSIDTRTAVFAGLLMLTLPVMSRWAQDNRMYAPATACVVLAVACWWTWITGRSTRWAVGYGAAVIGVGLFHLYALTVMPALVLGALWAPGPRRSNLLRTIAPLAIAAIVLLPHLYLNAAHPTGSPTNPPASLESLESIVTDDAGPILFGLVALLALIGSVWAWRSRDRRAIVALGLGWVLCPLVLFVLARAILGMPTLSPRYDLFAIPGLCLLAACGLSAVDSSSRPAAIVAALVLVAVALPTQVAVRSSAAHDPGSYRLASLLERPELAGLPIVAAGEGISETLDAATYPARMIAPRAAAARPVAVIVAGSAASLANGRTPYQQPGGPWRRVVECAPGPAALLGVEAVPGAGLPAGSPDALASQLNAAVPGANCTAEP